MCTPRLQNLKKKICLLFFTCLHCSALGFLHSLIFSLQCFLYLFLLSSCSWNLVLLPIPCTIFCSHLKLGLVSSVCFTFHFTYGQFTHSGFRVSSTVQLDLGVVLLVKALQMRLWLPNGNVYLDISCIFFFWSIVIPPFLGGFYEIYIIYILIRMWCMTIG